MASRSLLGIRRHLACGLVVSALVAFGGPVALRADERCEDRQLLNQVSAALLAVLDAPPGYEWPPQFRLVEEDEVNAYATSELREGKRYPIVTCYSRLMDQVIQEHEDRLALIVAHEIAHVLLNHVRVDAPGETDFLHAAFTREDEFAADALGMKLILEAGYSYQAAIGVWKRMDVLGLEYSSYEALGYDHPSWKDRLAHMHQDEARLWNSMSAFSNGVIFLTTEQYAAAERCFRQVTREFPECYEAWANLGYALLMRYCDALRPEDLQQFDLAQIVVGGFYRRPTSLEPRVRGIDEALWEAAVEALERALQLQPELLLPRANLGLAYLVRPAGQDVELATRYLQEALTLAENLCDLEPATEISLLINAGAADLAGGRLQECDQKLRRAVEIGQQASAAASGARVALPPALQFNEAFLLAASTDLADHDRAVDLLEQYLNGTNRSSAWWPLAYERYSTLCQARNRAAKAAPEFAAGTGGIRPIVAVELPSGVTLDVLQSVDSVIATLGEPARTPIVRGTTLATLTYADQGVELLAARQVLAIMLGSEKSPALHLQRAGLGSEVVPLKVGMSKDTLESALEGEPYDYRELDTPELYYRFYYQIGLAVRIRGSAVQELIITEIPRAPEP